MPRQNIRRNCHRTQRPECDPCDAGREPAPADPPPIDLEDAGLLCEGDDDDAGRPSAADADCRTSLEREPGREDEPDAKTSGNRAKERESRCSPPPGNGLFLEVPVSSVGSADADARTASRFLMTWRKEGRGGGGALFFEFV